jgi:hypothetical protein
MKKRPLQVPRWPEHRPAHAGRLERSRKARWKHGRYSAKVIQERRELRALLRHVRELLRARAGHNRTAGYHSVPSYRDFYRSATKAGKS